MKKTAKRAAKKKPSAPARKRTAELSSPVLEAGFPQALGIRLLTMTKRRITAELPVTEAHMNRTGRVAGGVIMSFADVLGAVGAVMHRPLGYRGGTVESKTNFFAAGCGPVLRAVTVPLHIGRTTSVWQTSVKNLDGGLVAVVTQTQIQLPRTAPGEGERT